MIFSLKPVVRELASKLEVLQTVFRLFALAAQKVEAKYAGRGDDMATDAVSIIRENIDASQSTLTRLLANQPKPLKASDSSSVLRRAVSYLCYDLEGKSVVEAGLRQIDDRVKSMEIALRFIET
jgi:hypothetical protein